MTDKISNILKGLFQKYPDAKTALKFSNPLELVIATILSAQATDKKVNEVTERLFKKYKCLDDFLKTDLKTLEEDIKEINYYRNKAKMIYQCCHQIKERFNSKVPDVMEELTSLSGIGRKTANVILGSGFGKPAIAVDTHVIRVANRLGLVNTEDPVKIELELMEIIPKEKWTAFSLSTILHGRETCKSRKPLCEQCMLSSNCQYSKYKS
ncbi:MAG TPA: endonuclease III [Nitrospirae bacterium]|nr:endonuclease III [Nitrospirota bacterium]